MAPINEDNPNEELDYQIKAAEYPDDLQLLKDDRDKDYCMKQCYKMCHYLQKVRQKELLQFKAEFLKDENGNIWLSFIKDFHIRRPFQNSRVANLMQDRGNAEALAAEYKQQREALLR